MLCDYTNNLYMPLAKVYNKYYTDLSTVGEFSDWKNKILASWDKISIEQFNNLEDISIDAGNEIEVNCKVKLPDISEENIEVETYSGKINENGTMEDIKIIPMKLVKSDDENKEYYYKANLQLTTGGNYGYTFRVIPKHKMLLNSKNLNLIKWLVN